MPAQPAEQPCSERRTQNRVAAMFTAAPPSGGLRDHNLFQAICRR